VVKGLNMAVQVADTPLARLLSEYAWSRRPPLTIGQLAIKAGVSRAAMYNWVGHGVTPTADNLYTVGVRLGIPLQDLYEAAGIPMPEVPRPRRTYGVPGSELLAADRAEMWEQMIVEVQDAMRAYGHGEPAIQQVVAHIRARQFPDRASLQGLEGNVVAEFAEPAESPAESAESGERARPRPSGRAHRTPQLPGGAAEPVNGGHR
jgi:hypothetical protein